MIGFTAAVKMFFNRYFDFEGRSSRAEYWWVILFQIIATIVLVIPIGIAAAVSGDSEPGALVFVAAIPLIVFFLAIIIPGIALFVRRLHDQNLTGWIYLGLVLGGLIPLVGLLTTIAQIVFACIPGTQGPNKYGPDPYGNDLSATFD